MAVDPWRIAFAKDTHSARGAAHTWHHLQVLRVSRDVWGGHGHFRGLGKRCGYMFLFSSAAKFAQQMREVQPLACARCGLAPFGGEAWLVTMPTRIDKATKATKQPNAAAFALYH